LAVFASLFFPGLAQANHRDHDGINATDASQISLVGATMLGVAGFLALRRSRRSS
jgi:LPXTG-motif cell wall-anchored protein